MKILGVHTGSFRYWNLLLQLENSYDTTVNK